MICDYGETSIWRSMGNKNSHDAFWGTSPIHSKHVLLCRCTGWDPWSAQLWALCCTTSCCSHVCAVSPNAWPRWRAAGPRRRRTSRTAAGSPSSSRRKPYKLLPPPLRLGLEGRGNTLPSPHLQTPPPLPPPPPLFATPFSPWQHLYRTGPHILASTDKN